MADFPDIGSIRRVNISTERQIYVVPMLTVENVMRMLVCSRSSAYEHMNRALGRTERPGKLLRVPLDVFESYIVHTLKLAAPRARQLAPNGGLSRSTATVGTARSEERRVGKECRSRWSPY